MGRRIGPKVPTFTQGFRVANGFFHGEGVRMRRPTCLLRWTQPLGGIPA